MYLFVDWILKIEVKMNVHILWKPELWMANVVLEKSSDFELVIWTIIWDSTCGEISPQKW